MNMFIIVRVHQHKEELVGFVQTTEHQLIDKLKDRIMHEANKHHPYNIFDLDDVEVFRISCDKERFDSPNIVISLDFVTYKIMGLSALENIQI